ncbi:hypothetical protein, variant 2, partial [Aphanomyces astaci]
MVDLVDESGTAAKTQASLFTLPSMTRLLLDTEMALVKHAVADVQEETLPDKSQRRFTLAQHSTFVQLTRVLVHVRTTVQTSDKLAMNLLQSLGPVLSLHGPFPAVLSNAATRCQLLFAFLFHCHPPRVLGYFSMLFSSPNDKPTMLRALVHVRDLAIHTAKAMATSHLPTTPSVPVQTTLWFDLLSAAVARTKAYAAADELGRRGPTKLSLAAADAALAIVHVLALTIVSEDNDAAMISHLQALLAQVLDELAHWYSGIRHRALFVLVLHSFRSNTCDVLSKAWRFHIHQSILLFQSTFPHSKRLVSRMLRQPRPSWAEPAAFVSNLMCALGRVNVSHMTADTHRHLLAIAVEAMQEAPSACVGVAIFRHVFYHHSKSAPDFDARRLWELLTPLVNSLINPSTALQRTADMAEILVMTQYPLERMVTALECADTPDPIIVTLLRLSQYMMAVHQPSGSAAPPTSSATALHMAKTITPSVLMLCDHHPSMSIRRQAASLLPSLDGNLTVSHYLGRLPSPHAHTMLTLMVATPVSCQAAVASILAGIQNLGYPQVQSSSSSIRSPADILAPCAPPATTDAAAPYALQACPRWLAQVPPSNLLGVLHDVTRVFFRSSRDTVSMVILRELLKQFPHAFAQILPVVLAHLETHVAIVYEPTNALLFFKLRPLLALRMAAVTCFTNLVDPAPIVKMLLTLMSEDRESEDIRKLAADILAKLPVTTTVPMIRHHLRSFLQSLPPPSATSSQNLPRLDAPSSAQTTTLMVYCLSMLVVNHVESSQDWLSTVLELVLEIWGTEDVTATSSSSDGMSLLYRVQRGGIECMTVLLHHATTHRPSTRAPTYAEWVECWLEAAFRGRFAMLNGHALEMPPRLCCCNVLLNCIPRLDMNALATLVTYALPYIHDCLVDQTPPISMLLLSACLKLLMTLIKHRGLQATQFQHVPSVANVVLATTRLVASASENAQISMEAAQTIVVFLSEAKQAPQLVPASCLADMARYMPRQVPLYVMHALGYCRKPATVPMWTQTPARLLGRWSSGLDRC